MKTENVPSVEKNVPVIEMTRREVMNVNQLLSNSFMVPGISESKQLGLVELLLHIEELVKTSTDLINKTVKCLTPKDFEKLRDDKEKKEEYAEACRKIDNESAKILNSHYEELVKIPYEGLTVDEVRILMKSNENSLTLNGMKVLKKYFVK